MTHLKILELRSFIYSFVITAGFATLIIILNHSTTAYYIVTSIIIYLVIVIEILFSVNNFSIKHKKNSKAKYLFEDHPIIQITHHLLYPTILYAGLNLFLFLNFHILPVFFILISSFLLFQVLYKNIYSFYHHNFSLNLATNYIYDLISIVVVFLYVSIYLDIISIQDYSAVLIFLIFISIFFNALLLILRHSFTRSYLMMSFLMSIVTTIIVVLTYAVTSRIILSALIGTIFYQFFNFYVNNSNQKKINKEGYWEYLLVVVLALSLVIWIK